MSSNVRTGVDLVESGASTELLLAYRNLLFTVNCEMLGSVADAEDARQETWLRWAEVDPDSAWPRCATWMRG